MVRGVAVPPVLRRAPARVGQKWPQRLLLPRSMAAQLFEKRRQRPRRQVNPTLNLRQPSVILISWRQRLAKFNGARDKSADERIETVIRFDARRSVLFGELELTASRALDASYQGLPARAARWRLRLIRIL
jgi:hypothetical protein